MAKASKSVKKPDVEEIARATNFPNLLEERAPGVNYLVVVNDLSSVPVLLNPTLGTGKSLRDVLTPSSSLPGVILHGIPFQHIQRVLQRPGGRHAVPFFIVSNSSESALFPELCRMVDELAGSVRAIGAPKISFFHCPRAVLSVGLRRLTMEYYGVAVVTCVLGLDFEERLPRGVGATNSEIDDDTEVLDWSSVPKPSCLGSCTMHMCIWHALQFVDTSVYVEALRSLREHFEDKMESLYLGRSRVPYSEEHARALLSVRLLPAEDVCDDSVTTEEVAKFVLPTLMSNAKMDAMWNAKHGAFPFLVETDEDSDAAAHFWDHMTSLC